MTNVMTDVVTDVGTDVVLAIDQGTTGTTVLLLDAQTRVVGRAYREIPQHYPQPSWVEHDPEDLARSVMEALGEALSKAGNPRVRAIGITNQRETTVLWERKTGLPVARAIVWQDRRTQDACVQLRAAGHEPFIRERTGLLLDPYFSATKVAWLLDRNSGLRARAERGEIAFGTVDSFLVARLSGLGAHITDVTNASRTLLFDLHTLDWNEELARLFAVPMAVLPKVVASASAPGTALATTLGVPGVADGTPIAGIAGDQQAALYGQGCISPGDAKCTYGTGAFLLMNVGPKVVTSQSRLLTSVAWTKDETTLYALEGSAFIAGALVQWLRDGLGIISRASEIEALAASVPDAGGVTIVPALAGLGAPHWRPDARGIISGITRGTTRAHIAHAALEAIALTIVELVRAMESDSGRRLRALRVDGGAAANDLLMQMQADRLGVQVVRPTFVESTALGAGRLAGEAVGFFTSDAASADRGTTFTPRWSDQQRSDARERFAAAVAKA